MKQHREILQDVFEWFSRTPFWHAAREVAYEREGRELNPRPLGLGLLELAAKEILQLARIFWDTQSGREVRPELVGKRWGHLHERVS